jgi:hypothetical protein
MGLAGAQTSGLAHGQTWATFGILDQQIVSGDDVAYTVKLTAPEVPLVGVVSDPEPRLSTWHDVRGMLHR